MLALSAILLLLVTTLFSIVTRSQSNGSKVGSSNEIPYIRDYLYSGGRYADDGSRKGQHVFMDQIYVERLAPVNGETKTYPIVFIHGQAQTGTVRHSFTARPGIPTHYPVSSPT